MKKNAIVGQSGGPTAVINASLYGVVYEALNREDVIGTIYGMINGIEGFLNENMMDMKPLEVNGELELIKTTPGSYLGSCRYKLPEDLTDAVYPQLFEKFEKYNIGYFFYIGGNDSMDTVSKLSRYAETVDSEIRFIGIPKTIDNDLVLTDHTPGFGSAAKYVASTVREIAIDASVYDNKKSVTIVEIMGRHAGWLTAAAALAEGKNGNVPYLVYLEEKPFSLDRFIDDVKEKLASTNAVLVAVSEGVHDTEGRFLCEQEGSRELDVFGHTKLSGTGKILEEAVRAKIGCKVRSIELNLLQRCAGHILSKTDIEESGNLGANAVKLAVAGESGLMSSLTRVSDTPYTVEYSGVDIREVANKEKKIPVEWINEAGNGVKEELITYLTPLVQGEVSSIYENGMPSYLLLK